MKKPVLAFLFVVAGNAWAAPPGTMIITNEPIDSTDRNFEKDAKKSAVSELGRSANQWTVNFVAFLKKPAGHKEVQVVFYDTADKVHEPTNNFPIDTQPTAKILTSSVSFDDSQGFKPGHTYRVLITRLIDGKEDIYAQSKVTLK